MKKRLLATMSVVMVGSMLLAGCGKTEDAATTYLAMNISV